MVKAAAKASPATLALEFEKPILQLERQIAELVNVQETKNADYADEINGLRQSLTALLRKTYQNLTAWETVQVARHPQRPLFRDYVELLPREFRELHGDRRFADDGAMIGGL